MKPTPGPWKVNKSWGTVEGPWQQEICAIFPADESGRREPRATAQANAQLIASAPDLLKALADLLEVAERELDQSATHDGLNNCELLAQARAAISKAGG